MKEEGSFTTEITESTESEHWSRHEQVGLFHVAGISGLASHPRNSRNAYWKKEGRLGMDRRFCWVHLGEDIQTMRTKSAPNATNGTNATPSLPFSAHAPQAKVVRIFMDGYSWM